MTKRIRTAPDTEPTPQEPAGEAPAPTPTEPAVKAGTGTPERKPVEALRDELATPAYLFNAAKAKHNWPLGQELTLGDYEAALKATNEEVIG